MTRVMLTFLGTGNYIPTEYTWAGYRSPITPYIQMALLDAMEHGHLDFQPDVVCPLLTAKARELNWDSNHGKGPGLSDLMTEWAQRQPYPVEIKPVELGESRDELSIWGNFQAIYQFLRGVRAASGDEQPLEVCVDVTHSFRYQPMLILTLLHFAKVVEGVQIAGVFYGEQPLGDGVRTAPIVNLLPLVELQDWILNVQMYLRGANAEGIRQLIQEKRHLAAKRNNPLLNRISRLEGVAQTWVELTESLQLCRGPEIHEMAEESLRRLELFFQASGDNLSLPSFEPILLLLHQIEAEIRPLADADEFESGIEAIRWCQRHGLTQQAYTLLREFIITTLCRIQDWDPLDSKCRKQIEHMLGAGANAMRDAGGNPGDAVPADVSEELGALYQRIARHHTLFTVWNQVSDDRNDVDHAGWRRGNLKPATLKRHLTAEIDDVHAILREVIGAGGERNEKLAGR